MNENLESLKNKIKELHLENAYGTLQVSYGCKKTNGVYSEEKCIRFGVEKKIPIDQIPIEKRIPPTIVVDGVEYKTDVYVAPTKVYTSEAVRAIEDAEANDFIFASTLSTCNDVGTYTVPPVVSPPVSYNRATVRPIRGGASMASPPTYGYFNAGTIGVVVVDDTDGKMVGLSNSHVCTKPGNIYGSTAKFFAGDTNYPATYSIYNNIDVFQQSSWDSGVANKAADKIGITKRSYPLSSTGTNYVDCAIVNLSSSFVDTNSWDVIGATFGGTPPPFATTAEIDAITTSTPIFKSGRTTGPIGPDTYSGCVIQITDTTVSLYVSGYSTGGGDSVLFDDCIQLESTGVVVGIGGDSGAGVYAKIGGVWKLIGLYFAGTGFGSPGFACRIDRIASLLKVSAYTGGAVDADPASRSYLTLGQEFASVATASYGGKIYWQVGRNP